MAQEKWYKHSLRRNLIDMHIEDWNDEFLSKFDADDYFDNLVKAEIQSPMIYLQSHTGLCNFDTKVSETHKAFIKDNKIKTLVKKCVDAGMDVIGYYSLIYNTREQLKHPDWAMRYYDGRTFIELYQRYGLCCPNNENYREFVKAQIKEMSEQFKGFKGMFYDMPFWPMPCHCDSCKKRYKEETGRDLPEKEDWNDDNFKLYIRKLQEWMGDFTSFVRKATNEIMPEVTVEFNYAGVLAFEGKCGSTELINENCEFAGGDLYGDLYNHSFCAKYYNEVTKNKPFEYMICRCDSNLQEHTASKTDSMLETEVMLTSFHHGANFVIDAINPDGTLDKRVYERMGKIFDKSKAYEKFYEGSLTGDVATFFDSKAMFNSHRGYQACNKFSAINSCKTLIENHIPVNVLANGIVDRIYNYKTVIAGELEDFFPEYEAQFIDFVKKGGTLYLSGKSNKNLMKEFFNASFVKFTDESKTYIAPCKEYEKYFGEFNDFAPMPINYALPIFDVKDESMIKGTITLPYTNPTDYLHYASIHSNPPGIKTRFPAILETTYGKGKVIWCAGAIEQDERFCFKKVFVNIVKYLANNDFTVKAELASNVELVTFKTENGYIFNMIELVNVEERLKKDFVITFNSNSAPKNIVALPDGLKVTADYSNDKVKLSGTIENFASIKAEF